MGVKGGWPGNEAIVLCSTCGIYTTLYTDLHIQALVCKLACCRCYKRKVKRPAAAGS